MDYRLLLMGLLGIALVGCGDDGGTPPGDAGTDADAGPMVDSGPGDSGPEDACTPTTETCNGSDDDCDGTVDEGFDLSTDPDHCGECGMVCEMPANGTRACSAGSCAIDSCDSGFDDCDEDVDNGCEAMLLDDAANCGECGNECADGFSCVMGVCGNAVVQVAAGGDHTCAALQTGDLYCWGGNGDGQLGVGDSDDRAEPTEISTLPDVSQVVAGAAHTCVLRRSGDVSCFGAGDLVGDGPGPDRDLPVAVDVPGDVVQLTAGAHATCARTDAGSVYCWGLNPDAQLGTDADTSAVVHEPTQVAPGDLEDAVDVSVGGGGASGGEHVHACAVRSGGEVVCWGNNDWGQLGDDGTTTRSDPDVVTGLDDGSVVRAGSRHTCALRSGGEVACWGSNEGGRVAPDASDPQLTPATVDLSDGEVTALEAGWQLDGCADRSCVLLDDGTSRCWGSGMLGDGADTACDTAMGPTDTDAPPSIQITVGRAHACALTETRDLYCWGAGGRGQLGDGETMDRASPVLVAGLP